MGAALLSGSAGGGGGGSIGRHRRPSTGYGSGYGRPALADRLFGRTDEEDECQEMEQSDAPVGGELHGNGVDRAAREEADVSGGEEKEFKPVFLKGLFRYVRSVRYGSVRRKRTELL